MDNQSLLEKAINEFFSNEGKSILQGTVWGKYLKDRIEEAFVAGWTYCRRAMSDKKNEDN